MSKAYSTEFSATRREGRQPVRLPCKLNMKDHELHATVHDLSYGGAGVSLMPGTYGIQPSALRSISIQDVGTFDVVFRWKTSDKLGVAFKSEASARARLKAYFDANGISLD